MYFNFRTISKHSRLVFALVFLLIAAPIFGQQGRRLDGDVRDPLGALVANAKVDLMQGESVVGTTATGGDGSFHFGLPQAGRYRVRVSAPGFQTTLTGASYYSGSGKAQVEVTLATQTLTQEVTVTATGTPVPEAQTGASVTVLTAGDFGLIR